MTAGDRDTLREHGRERLNEPTVHEHCGELHGPRDHRLAGEKLCAACALIETWARVYHETIPQRPPRRGENR